MGHPPDLPCHERAVLAKGDPVHLQDVAVVGFNSVRLSRVSVLSDDDLLHKKKQCYSEVDEQHEQHTVVSSSALLTPPFMTWPVFSILPMYPWSGNYKSVVFLAKR